MEQDLARYYDREGAERANRDLAPGRHAARDKFLAQYATAGMRSLEIGCGPGRDLQSFADSGLVAFGVDLSEVFAQLATSTGALLANATARKLPFRTATFDVVWSMSVLMHIPDDSIADALSEIRRVVREDGVVCIGVWGGDGLNRVLDGAYGARFFANRTRNEWSGWLSRIGHIEQFEEWDPDPEGFAYHWAVVRPT